MCTKNVKLKSAFIMSTSWLCVSGQSMVEYFVQILAESILANAAINIGVFLQDNIPYYVKLLTKLAFHNNGIMVFL